MYTHPTYSPNFKLDVKAVYLLALLRPLLHKIFFVDFRNDIKIIRTNIFSFFLFGWHQHIL